VVGNYLSLYNADVSACSCVKLLSINIHFKYRFCKYIVARAGVSTHFRHCEEMGKERGRHHTINYRLTKIVRCTRDCIGVQHIHGPMQVKTLRVLTCNPCGIDVYAQELSDGVGPYCRQHKVLWSGFCLWWRSHNWKFNFLVLRQISSNGRRPLPPQCHGLVDQISWLTYRQRVLETDFSRQSVPIEKCAWKERIFVDISSRRDGDETCVISAACLSRRLR